MMPIPSHHLVTPPQPRHCLVELKPEQVNLCLLCCQSLTPCMADGSHTVHTLPLLILVWRWTVAD
jgi:hypothetical protein